MPRSHVRPLTFFLAALLMLVAVMNAAAQKRTSERMSVYGDNNVTHNTDYNSDGAIYREEFIDSKGRVRDVNTYSYDPDTRAKLSKNNISYREDGSIRSDEIYNFDKDGKLASAVLVHYGPDGTQTGGYIDDLVNHKLYFWEPSTGRYEESTFPSEPKEKPTPSPKKAGDISYQPTQIGMIVPANLQPGETFSASVMPAAEAQNYSKVPGFAVKTFTTSLRGGEFSPSEYQGLRIGNTYSAAQPVLGGCFSATVPPASTNFSLFAQQEFQPNSQLSTINLDLPRPSWADEPVIHPPVWNGGDSNYWLDYLNYLWFKVTDYEEEYWDADYDGAPNWVLDEIGADQDDAQDAADYLAHHLPLDAVRNLAQKKANWEHWLDETYHGGMSYVHKDNVDYYTSYAVPQDYYFLKSLHSLVAPPILQVGRLGVLRGDFPGDCGSTRVDVDGSPVRFIGSTQSSYYFMPPDTMTTGPHTLNVWNGMFGYKFPVFSMKLSMSIDLTLLHTKMYPTSTKWSLSLTGINGMQLNNWTGGGFNPDLVSPSDLGTLPQGFSLNDQTRQGTILVRVTNASPTVIAIPEITGDQRTWILDAQSFAPAGEFHIDATANALRDGNFSVLGLAVATLKPIEGTPMTPPGTFPGGIPISAVPLQKTWPFGAALRPVSFGGNLRDASTEVTPQTQEAGQKYLEARSATKVNRAAMIDAWKKALATTRPQFKAAYENAAKEYGVAFKAWRDFEKELNATPSEDNRKKFEQLKQDRLRKKIQFENAREIALNGMTAAARDAWHAAETDYKNAAEHQSQAREGLETAWKASGGGKG